MITLEDIKEIIGSVLQLGSRVNEFNRETPLLGSIPEFDSMAVVSVITAMEDNFGIIVEDDEVSADIFETIGDLYDFVAEKIDN